MHSCTLSVNKQSLRICSEAETRADTEEACSVVNEQMSEWQQFQPHSGCSWVLGDKQGCARRRPVRRVVKVLQSEAWSSNPAPALSS